MREETDGAAKNKAEDRTISTERESIDWIEGGKKWGKLKE